MHILFLAEREKRTDAVLDMQKSKQDRSDQELQGLRDLYSEQEREIRLLQLNLDGTKEIMVKQQERFAKGYVYVIIQQERFAKVLVQYDHAAGTIRHRVCLCDHPAGVICHGLVC